MRKCFTIIAQRPKEDILSFEEHLVKTKEFSGCEIFYPYNVSEEQKDIYSNTIKNFTKYENFEIVLHMPYAADSNIAIDSEEIMQRQICAINFAHNYGVKKLTLHPGFMTEGVSREEAINISVKNTKVLCEHAKKYQMTIMIENLVGSHELCLNEDELLEYFKLVNMDNCKFILDCGHYNVANHNKDLKDVVYKLKNYLVHLHLSNNYGLRDEHAPLDKGNIDFKVYFKYLCDINYNGLYCSEVLYKDYHDLLNTSKLMDKYDKEGKRNE